eukprot:SAG31_NODE_3356_length_4367_cov_5.456888_4_plen_384_part_00
MNEAAKSVASDMACFDRDSDCPGFAARGDCETNHLWMLPNCPYSCSVCKPPSGCVDTDEQCAAWAARGECSTNADWMRNGCPRSCAATAATQCANVDQPCIDLLAQCSGFAAMGQCRPVDREFNSRSREWMGYHCGRSCYTCRGVASSAPSSADPHALLSDSPSQPSANAKRLTGACIDHDDSCKEWAAQGECHNNPSFMLSSCAYTCNPKCRENSEEQLPHGVTLVRRGSHPKSTKWEGPVAIGNQPTSGSRGCSSNARRPSPLRACAAMCAQEPSCHFFWVETPPSENNARFGHCCLKTDYDRAAGWKDGSGWVAYGAFYSFHHGVSAEMHQAQRLRGPPMVISPTREKTFSKDFADAMKSKDSAMALDLIQGYYDNNGGG